MVDVYKNKQKQIKLKNLGLNIKNEQNFNLFKNKLLLYEILAQNNFYFNHLLSITR